MRNIWFYTGILAATVGVSVVMVPLSPRPAPVVVPVAVAPVAVAPVARRSPPPPLSDALEPSVANTRPPRAPALQHTVGPGQYRPQFPVSPEEANIFVPPFNLDVLLVTQSDFAAFVTEHPAWRRDQVSPLFADAGYLRSWANATTPGAGVHPASPITEISWFAAQAYCESRGAALPTIAQWELAAAADTTRADASDDPAFVQSILAWYARPNPPRLPAVGLGTPNLWGVHDLHGLVWEWTLDFNADLVATDARDQNDPDRLQFCGTGALGAKDTADYASFMRVAMRTSLKARYATPNLGFRCATALQGDPP